MADRVITGSRRGNEEVTLIELGQMIGRAGRDQFGGDAYVDIFLERCDFQRVVSQIDDKNSFLVNSSLTDESLLFHILPDINSGKVRDVKTAKEWFKRSFFYYQKGERLDIEDSLDALEKMGAIYLENGYLTATEVGNLSAQYYYHPDDIISWKNNFTELFESSLEDNDLAISWALGNVLFSSTYGNYGQDSDVVEDCKGRMPPGLYMHSGCASTITCWWGALGGASMGKMRSSMLALREDYGRLGKVLRALNKKVGKWGMEDFFDDLDYRIRRSIPISLFQLCKDIGLSKGRASFLYNRGIRSVEDLVYNMDGLEGEIDDEFYEKLKRASELSGKVDKGLRESDAGWKSLGLARNKD